MPANTESITSTTQHQARFSQPHGTNCRESRYWTWSIRAWFCLLILLSPPLVSADNSINRQMMASAMAQMMEAMVMFSGIPGQMDMEKQWTPWMSAFTDPELSQGLRQMMEQTAEQVPIGKNEDDPTSTQIDGIWEDPDANLLIVRDQRFRLYSATSGYIEGQIERRGDLIAFLEPESGSLRIMEIARQGPRLVMRDDLGRVYLYRQLWSDVGTANRPMP